MTEAGRRRAQSSTRTGWFWRSMLVNVAAVLGVLCILSTIVVLVAGLTPIVVESSSMRPAISAGDLALAKTVPAGDIGVGDVVSVDNRRGMRVTHRVALVEPYGARIRLTLKADASAGPDAETYEVASADKIVAVIPWAGHVVGSPLGLAAGGIFIACLGLVVFIPRRRMRGARRVGT